MQTLYRIIEWVRWMFGIFPRSGLASPKERTVYLIVHYSFIFLVTVLLACLSNRIRTLFGFPLHMEHLKPWFDRILCGVLFVLFYAIVRVVLYLLQLFGIQEESDFPDIEADWKDIVTALSRDNLFLDDLPLFLVNGLTPQQEQSAFEAASQLEWRVIAPPVSRPTAVIRAFASDDAIFLSCTGVGTTNFQQGKVIEVADSESGIVRPSAAITGTRKAGEMPSPARVLPSLTGTHAGLPPAQEPAVIDQPLPQAGGMAAMFGTMTPGGMKRAMGTFAALNRGDQKGYGKKKVAPLSDLEIQIGARRMRYLCELIATARRPFCQINGMLQAYPFSWASDPEYSARLAPGIREDLITVHDAFQLQFPVVAVVTELDAVSGMRDFLLRSERLHPGLRLSRAGSSFAPGADVNDKNAAWVVDKAMHWFRGWVYTAFSTDIDNKDNQKLFQMLCEVSQRRLAMVALLRETLYKSVSPGIRLHGTYFAATGRTSTEQGFVRGILDKLKESQGMLAWSPLLVRQQQHSRVLSVGLLLGSVLISRCHHYHLCMGNHEFGGSMTSGDNRDWRGGRAPRNAPRSEKAVPTWKQSRSTSSSSSAPSSGSWKRKFRIALLSGFLLALVAAAIYFFRPVQSLTTHFVLLNLKHESINFDAAAEFELPPDYRKNTYRRVVTLADSTSLRFLESGDKKSQTDLNNAQVVIIYLQTTFIAAPDGKLRCLLRNSSPNLKTDEYINLETLKDEITLAAKKHPKKHWLLLVDQIPPGLEWRTGFLPCDVNQEFESWSTDIPELAVVLSSGVSDGSEPGTPGTGGRSVFSYFASLGLSRLATQDPNGDLTKSEFCRYVSERTNTWVRTHRKSAGQKVIVFPAGDERNFVIMRDAVALPPVSEDIALTGTQDAELSKQCKGLWDLRESLKVKGGAIWSPVIWRAATEELKRAERAMLHGLNSDLQQAISRSTDYCNNLENDLKQICLTPADFDPKRGFFRKSFASLPSANRAMDLFEAPSTGATSADDMALIEDVVASHLKPFETLSGVNQSEIETLRVRRKKAEESISQLFNCAYSLRHTVSAIEHDLLRSEDRLFTSITHDAAGAQRKEEQRIDEILEAIARFAETHDSAETTLRNALDCIPELAFWAAHCNCGDSEEVQDLWRTALSMNSPGTSLKVTDIEGLGVKLSHDSSDAASNISGPARTLRKEVFLLCAYSSGLKATLEKPEPDKPGYNIAGLNETIGELRAWNSLTTASLKNTLQAAEDFCRSAMDANPAQRIAQVRIYQILREALDLACVGAGTHNDVRNRLLRWNSELSRPSGNTDTEETNSSDAWHFAADLEALWLLQVLKMMPESESRFSEINDQHRSLGEFGEAVRGIWLINRQNADDAVKSTSEDPYLQLRAADFQVRLYSGFDAKMEAQRSPATPLRQLAKLHYCLMQADRVLSGLWIDTGEQTKLPLSEHGRFARATTAWLDAARGIFAGSSAGQTPSPAVDAAIQNLQSRLIKSDDLELIGKYAKESSIDLGDESKPDEALSVTVMQTVPDMITGEASVLIRLSPEGGVAEALSIDRNALPVEVKAENNNNIDLRIRRLGHPASGEGCNPFELQPEVFFRGRSWYSAQNISVSICAAREFVTEILPRATTASITVSGDDPRPVILILDFSDSMKETLTDGTPRYEAAIGTLKTLIQRDDLRDARVVLKVFGHRVRYNSRTGMREVNPLYEKAFPDRPINKNVDTNNDIENMFEGTMRLDDKNNKDAFLKVLELLRSSGHWGSTPLIESIREAVATDLGRNSGIVIAITDGTPTDDGDGTNEPDRTRALKLALDGNTGTNVNVVAFDIDQNVAERNRLKTTFDKFEGRVSIVDAANETGLREKIQQSLDPRKFTVKWDADTQSNTADLEGSVRELPPGDDFFVQFGNTTSIGPLALNPGDSLQLNLLLQENRFRVSRSQSTVLKRAESGSNNDHRPWILKSIDGPELSDIEGEDKNLFARAKLRLMLDHDDDGQIVRQPAEIDFLVRNQDSPNRPQQLSQRFDSSRGAPAWEFTIDKWPKGRSFLVDAVWKMERSVPEYLVEWEKLATANSPATAIRLDEDSNGLPPGKVWTTLRSHELQVRIDPVPPYPETNRPEDVRIEVGQSDTQEQAKTFLPWELATTVIRTERGTVIYKFSGDKINADNLKRVRIAFTSSANRENGATIIRNFQIPVPY